MAVQDIIDKAYSGERIGDEEFLVLASEAAFYDLGFLANTIRNRKHPGNTVTYVIDRNINYTDICISACKFCAYFKAPEDKKGMVLSRDELSQKIEETLDLGGTQILLQGGLHPDLTLGY